MARETSSTRVDGGDCDLAGKYLTFLIGEDSCGIAVRSVREIVGMMAISPARGSSSQLDGVINLRGKIIPILDLRCTFQSACRPATEHACIIVAQIAPANGSKSLLGFTVDAVQEVINVDPADRETSNGLNSKIPSHCLLGAVKANGIRAVLINLEALAAADGPHLRLKAA